MIPVLKAPEELHDAMNEVFEAVSEMQLLRQPATHVSQRHARGQLEVSGKIMPTDVEIEQLLPRHMTGIRQMLGNAAICHEVEAMGAQEPSELLKEWYAVTFIEATASSTNHAIGDDIDLDVAAVVTETDEPLARSLTIGCDEGDIMTYTGLIETSMTNPYGHYVGMTMAPGRAIDLEEIRKDFGPADVDDIHNLMKDVFAAAVDGEPVTPGNLRDIFQKQYQQGLGDTGRAVCRATT